MTTQNDLDAEKFEFRVADCEPGESILDALANLLLAMGDGEEGTSHA